MPDRVKPRDVELTVHFETVSVILSDFGGEVIAAGMSCEENSVFSAPAAKRFEPVAVDERGESVSPNPQSLLGFSCSPEEDFRSGFFNGATAFPEFGGKSVGTGESLFRRLQTSEKWFIGEDSPDMFPEFRTERFKITPMDAFDEIAGRLRTEQVGSVVNELFFNFPFRCSGNEKLRTPFRMFPDEFAVEGSAGPSAFIVEPAFHAELRRG